MLFIVLASANREEQMSIQDDNLSYWMTSKGWQQDGVCSHQPEREE